ncbi:hypothetical protein JCM14244_17110 [Venenivibrio stagnispumantis]|nr:hypothetical protein [Venenivibrio stagnispumantis]MCW4573968.1 hypothetical protein [Venenivibrio stagnispumantis]
MCLYEIKEEIEITNIKIQERIKIANKLKEKGLSEEEIAKLLELG